MRQLANVVYPYKLNNECFCCIS
ncbi:hypothetical protein Zm00014a_043480 [Zea mays]|uniref:Uncharacterized protein n=1 Tax=Zea mays TaxID=4577 RepID=A0A3L6FRU4_MAIZE|nr:hypothetical protein Zm00014a_043480 [Zea mays]